MKTLSKYILIWMLFWGKTVLAGTGYATIHGNLPFAKDGDIVSLEVNKYGIGAFYPNFQQHLECKVKNQSFYFKVKSGKFPLFFYFHCTAWDANQAIRGYYFIEEDDNVRIDDIRVTGYLHFSGKGAKKLNVLYKISEINNFYSSTLPPAKVGEITKYLQSRDSCASNQLNYLNSNKNLLTQNAYNLIKAYIVSQIVGKAGDLNHDFFQHDSIGAVTVLNNYRDNLLHQFYSPLFLMNEQFHYSPALRASIIAKYKLDSCIAVNRPFDVKKCYLYLKNNFKADLRERLVTEMIYDRKDKGVDLSDEISDALGYFKKKDFVFILKKLRAVRLMGGLANNFSLPDTNGVLKHLSDFKGKVVLIDFWYTGCGNCAELYPYLHKVETTFKESPVTFISISVDKSRDTWTKSINRGLYTSNEVVNLYTGGSGNSHPLLVKYQINLYPTLLLIDSDGKLIGNAPDPRLDNGDKLTKLIIKFLK
ncbi:TlpA family protein disulfide reductase [Mucilaginibacter gracilis]|nr:TlpA disulfide reductase family protein [Mucilaginibacter gracilis]